MDGRCRRMMQQWSIHGLSRMAADRTELHQRVKHAFNTHGHWTHGAWWWWWYYAVLCRLLLPVTLVFRYFIEQTVMQSLLALLLCTVCSSTMQWVDRPFHRTQWQLILVLRPTLLLLQCSHFLVSSVLINSSFQCITCVVVIIVLLSVRCVLCVRETVTSGEVVIVIVVDEKCSFFKTTNIYLRSFLQLVVRSVCTSRAICVSFYKSAYNWQRLKNLNTTTISASHQLAVQLQAYLEEICSLL